MVCLYILWSLPVPSATEGLHCPSQTTERVLLYPNVYSRLLVLSQDAGHVAWPKRSALHNTSCVLLFEVYVWPFTNGASPASRMQLMAGSLCLGGKP